MKCPPPLPGEERRVEALAEYDLRAERPLPSLEPVVQIATRAFGMPIAAVNMIGSDQVFFAASAGVSSDGEGVNMSRDVSFCAHAIAQHDVLVVPDTLLDDRFHDNPLVTGPANVRFYAGVPLLSPGGEPLGALCVIDHKPHHDFSDEDRSRLRELAKMASDRLELRRVEVASGKTLRSFESFAKNSSTAVVSFDANGDIIVWNAAAASLFGYALADAEGCSVETLLSVRDRPAVRALIERGNRAGSVDGLEMLDRISGLRKDGTEFLLGISLFCWKEDGRLTFNVHLHDLTARALQRDELHRLAKTDTLTGLANRAGFYRRTEEAVLRSSGAAVLMVDIDGFKDVNDTLGHQMGDSMLCEIARRFERAVGVGDVVARIGGDEFAILLPGISNPTQASALAERLIASVAKPIVIDGHQIRVAASCGVAVAPVHAHEALALVGNADLALIKAKQSGRGQVCVFVDAFRMEAVTRRLRNIELERAVSDSQFILFYQPQVRLRDNMLVGAEALLRWQHPERGLLSPTAFLPGLEGGPLAARMGAWVLQEACSQLAFWRRYGASDLRMGVNLFAAQFRVDDLVSDVLSALAQNGLPPDALELEVTENIVLEHDEHALAALRRLREEGVGIAFDDFGTGYASLSLLRKYPLSRLKIDRSFVQHVHESERDTSVVRAIIDMARGFGLDTIAEGIENEAQRNRLRALGCREGQGYLFSTPLPAVVFSEIYGFGLPNAAAART